MHQTDSIGHAKNMPIDRQARNAERVAKDDVRRFASHPGKFDQRFHVARNLASMRGDERARHPGKTARLGAKKAR